MNSRPLSTSAFVLSIAVTIALVFAPSARGQMPETQIINVDESPMRVRVRGVDQRQDGWPVVVLEAGAGSGLETWAPIFDRVAALAPVVAYDRRGLGKSAADSEPQTLARAARSLHSLLLTLKVSPPYVLVGHSYGGVVIRAFAQQYGSEVAGLVYLDVPDVDLTYAEADEIGPGARQVAFAPPSIPSTVPAGVRGELENIVRNVQTEFAEARAARPPAGIPSAAVISTQRSWTGANPEMAGALLRLAIKHQQEWVLSSPQGMLVVARHVGHIVHRDDPDLVLRLVTQVLPRAGK
jgi:pimeloyl-ACP methyl ester carboxylesterase